MQGLAFPKASITILVDGKVATIITAGLSADFKVELTTLSSGTYTFGLWAKDKEGRRSITFSFTSSIVSGKTTTISSIFIPPTIELNRVNILKNEDLEILGQTAPESEINIHIESGEEIIKKTKADELGNWDQHLSAELLEEGMHTVRAKSETEGGLLSSFSKVLSFFVGEKYLTSTIKEADSNGDGRVNLVDFSIMLYNWGKPKNQATDLNSDGTINLTDFSIMLYNWTG